MPVTTNLACSQASTCDSYASIPDDARLTDALRLAMAVALAPANISCRSPSLPDATFALRCTRRLD
jgi:hypothetical protein